MADGIPGRQVSRVSRRAVGAWSMRRPSHSRVEASTQCRSSHTISIGCRSASSRSHESNAACVCCLLLLRAQGQRRIVRRRRQRQEGGKQWHHVVQREVISLQHLLQLGQPRLRGIGPLPLQEPLQVLDHRVTGCCVGHRANSGRSSASPPLARRALAAPAPGGIYRCPPRR